MLFTHWKLIQNLRKLLEVLSLNLMISQFLQFKKLTFEELKSTINYLFQFVRIELPIRVIRTKLVFVHKIVIRLKSFHLKTLLLGYHNGETDSELFLTWWCSPNDALNSRNFFLIEFCFLIFSSIKSIRTNDLQLDT